MEFTEGVPLWLDEEHQTIRIIGTRLKLEAIVRLYSEGHAPQPGEIVEEFDVLTIEMAERIVDWCRRHPMELNAYMGRVEKEEESVLAQLAPRAEEDRQRRKEWLAQRAQAQPA